MHEIRKPPVGSKPGTLAIPVGASKPVLRVVVYDAETLSEIEPLGIDDIKKQIVPGRTTWIDVQGFGDERLLRELAAVFSIHPLALEDVVHASSRPKAEAYEHNLLVITKIAEVALNGQIATRQVGVVIGDNYVLTFQEGRGDTLDPVRIRLQVQDSVIRRSSSDYLGYAILDTVVDSFYPILDSVSETIEELEDRILTEASPDTLRELNSTKSELLVLRHAIAPHREAVNRLIRDDNRLVGDTVRTYLRDTYDHVIQATEGVESARELVNGLINTYLSVLSNRMNEVMKTLTIIASIFVPLTFLAGIYGMNFDHMPELHVKWAYPSLLAVMLVTALGMVVYFWRKDWIGRRR